MSADDKDHLLSDAEHSTTHLSLDSLPPDLLANCLQHLCSEDVFSLQTCSKATKAAVADQRVWYSLCKKKFSPYTNIRLWLPDPTASPQDIQYPIQPPSDYRQLYQMLKIVAPLALPSAIASGDTCQPSVGIWRIVGDAPQSAFVVCHWTENSIQAHRVTYTSLDHRPEVKRYASISPRQGLSCKVEWGDIADTNNVTLVDLTPGLRRIPSASCETTEAAASTALPFSPSTSRGSRNSSGRSSRNRNSGGGCSSLGGAAAPLGASPPGSFEAEWLTFMASNVAVGKSRLKKRSSRLAQSTQPVLHHLRRVIVPVPTARHPLSGLWLAAFPEGQISGEKQYAMHVLKLSYDFSGPNARIVAEQITSGSRSPGSIVFTASAAPLPLPWSDFDAALINQWRHQHWEQHLEAGLDGGLEGLLLVDDDDDLSATTAADTSSTNGTADEMNGRTSISHGQVVSVRMGIGNHGSDQYDGRLLVHGNGWLSFHWFVRHHNAAHAAEGLGMVEHISVSMRPLRPNELQLCVVTADY